MRKEMNEVMATDYIDSEGLYHFVRDNDYDVITRDKEYIEQVLNRKFGSDFDGDVIGIYGIKEEKEMVNGKTITLIGSMSETNKAAMMALYNRLTWKGSIVYLPYMDKVTEDASDEQIKTIHKLHEYKMSEANLIIVVDADGHIGKDTQREIDWCNEHGLNVIYLSDMQVYDFDPNSWLEPNCHGNIRPSDMRTKGGKK